MRIQILAVACFIAISGITDAQSVEHLQDVRRVYVSSLGSGDGADVIRSKIITRLTKSGRFEVVQSSDLADAVLTGAGQVSRSSHYSASTNGDHGSASGGTRYHATAGVQLINRNQTILWADDVSNGWFSRSASSNLADRIVKNLLKAIAKDEQRR